MCILMLVICSSDNISVVLAAVFWSAAVLLFGDKTTVVQLYCWGPLNEFNELDIDVEVIVTQWVFIIEFGRSYVGTDVV